ncbi:DUF2790 domain-containing protein [Pseudomonas sp. NA-150]|uniref:DUF2790 domain-containing protein n=1 Tax=Pseudomonas sp. NA-150 TaxID=3367525 RepID=UPI0037C89E33
MKLSNIMMLVALSSVGMHAVASEHSSAVATTNATVETYTYDTKLDIKKVIAVTDTSDQCGLVPVQMTYEDSRGQAHIIQYQALASGCSNG